MKALFKAAFREIAMQILRPKVLGSIFLVLLAIVGAIWISGNFGPSVQDNLKVIGDRALLSQANEDSDHDGLKNWEEALWKTDPNNPDTDGDGTPDGAEVKASRNPLKPVPGDELPTQNVLGGESASYQDVNPENFSSENLTQQLTKNFSLGALQNMQKGDAFSLSDSGLSTTAQDALQKFQATLRPSLSAKDFRLLPDNSSEAVKKYIFNINKLITTTVAPTVAEKDALLAIVQTYNATLAEEYANYYASIATNLKQISVPPAFYSLHKQGTEIFLGLSNTYAGLKEIKTDPLKALIAFQENALLRDELVKTLQDFADLAKKYAP